MIKLLINLFFGLLVLIPAYSLFYFKVVPRLINHYRNYKRQEHKYDDEIHAIQEEDEHH